MFSKVSIFLIIFVILSGCSGKKPKSYYAWKSKNIIVHDKVLDLKSSSSKVIQVREVKYYTINQRKRKDDTILYSTKEDKYVYLNLTEELVIHENSFQDMSEKYKSAILFSGDSICKNENYPCVFASLRLKGEVYLNGKKDHNLERTLSLSKPIRMTSKEAMHVKVYNFLLKNNYILE